MARYEISAHRIGGADGYRRYGPWETSVIDFGETWVDLIAQEHAAYFIQVILRDWQPVDDEWRAGTVELRSPDGQPLGRRPVMVYDRPYDIPTHALFQARYPDIGAYSLSIRCVSP